MTTPNVPPPTLIELQHLGKSFKDVRVLKSVDLKINKGDALVLIGNSGAGKTLVLKIIMGLIDFDQGKVEIEGKNIRRLTDGEKKQFMNRFGMTFQKSGLFDGLPVWHNVAFHLLQVGGYTEKQAREKAIEKLLAVGLSADDADLYPAELSGGMQKRVGLARAIAHDPDVLFLDEPTAGLDPIMSNVINDLIMDITDNLGATMVAITSDMVSAGKISDRIAMLHDGEIIWDGKTADARDSGNPYLDQFIHSRAEGPIQIAV